MRIIRLQDDMYVVRGTVSAETKVTNDELKKQFAADAVLRNGDKLYLCQKIIDAEFTDIK
jgi:hypothetical protein